MTGRSASQSDRHHPEGRAGRWRAAARRGAARGV